MSRRAARPRLRHLALGLVALAGPATALELTPLERAGKQLYLTGESPSGAEVTALVGRDDTPLPASALPCGSCHGEDGLGRAEGGARPPAITWTELVKPYGHVHPDGRKHPRYDARSLARSVTDGVDPAGNRLDPVMPRYGLSDEDLAALTAYLRKLERDRDPGVSEGELRFGAILPLDGPSAGVGAAMRAAVEARFAEVNRQGGVHGRRVRLVVDGYRAAGGAAAALASARRLVEKGGVLALVSGFFPLAEEDVFALAAKAEVPLVGPFTLFASQPESPNPHVFHLLSGVREQARVLADFAAERAGSGRIAIVHRPGPRLAEAAAAARARLERRGAGEVEVVALPAGPLPPSVAADLAGRGVRAVVLLGDDGTVAAFGAAAREAAFAPDLLVSGALAGAAALALPPELAGHVFLAASSLPGDEAPAARARLAAVERGGPPGARVAVAQADAAAAVVCEALRRTGRSVSRRALVASLEGLYRFEPGLVPPITYGPARRVGALGAYVVEVDPKARTIVPVGGWRGLD